MHERAKTICPVPRTLATGEQECPACGLTWAKEDGQPECSRQAPGDVMPYPDQKPPVFMKPSYRRK